MVGIVELSNFILEDLEIFAVLWWNAHNVGHPAMKPLWYFFFSATLAIGTPGIFGCPTLTLVTIMCTIKFYRTNILINYKVRS